MKKYFLSIVALAGMLFATSCQESLVEPQVGGTTTFTVQLPEAMGTKATIGGYELINRVYVEVYSANGPQRIYKPTNEDGTYYFDTFDPSTNSATIRLNLIQDQAYDIVFWAQHGESYNVSDLTKVQMNDIHHNSETGAAFFAKLDNFTPGDNSDVELRRPFAQLNLGTTQESLNTNAGQVTLSEAAITVGNIAATFNALAERGEGERTITFTAKDVPSQILEVGEVDYKYISMDYLPIAGDDEALVTVNATITLDNNQSISHEFTNVPVKENYRTNIVGNLISSTTDFVVKVNDDWAGDDYKYDSETGKVFVEVGTEDELIAAITSPEVEEVVLTADIDLTETLVFGVIQGTNPIARASAQRRDFIFDGNGKTLTSTAARAINVSGVDGVTIKNLTINCSGERAINIIQNATNVSIENVTATAANYTVNVAASAPEAIVNITNSTLNGLCTINVASPSAVVTVDKSTVNCNDNNTTDGESYAALCLNKAAVNGKIIATNTIVNVTEGSDSQKGRNGAEDGVVTINGSTEGVVVTVAVITFEGSDYYYGYASLEEAFEDAQKHKRPVTLIRNITVAGSIVILEGQTVVLDLNEKTITGTMHKSVGAVIKNNGTLTIMNGTISSTADNGGSAIQNKGTLTVEDATLNGAPNANGSWPSYTVNNTGILTINDSKITSYHGAVASYEAGAVVTLNDSEIDMAGIPGFTSHGIYTYDSGKVVVNGGTYANNATDQTASGASVINGAVEVNAGTFSGRIENYYGTPVLKGGTYSVKPNDKFIAKGYKAVQDGEFWKVVAE